MNLIIVSRFQPLKQVETLRVKSAALEAELTQVSARRKKEATRARRGAQAACQEQVLSRTLWVAAFSCVVVPFLLLPDRGDIAAFLRFTQTREHAPRRVDIAAFLRFIEKREHVPSPPPPAPARNDLISSQRRSVPSLVL